MFRKENGVTLVALVITIIVLLILAGVTISMVLGDDGIVAQAGDARAAQNKATVSDQLAVAYASVRAEQIARAAGVSTDTDITTEAQFTAAVAAELNNSKAFKGVKYEAGNKIHVQLDGTKGVEIYTITLNAGSNGTPTINYENGIAVTTTSSVFAGTTAGTSY